MLTVFSLTDIPHVDDFVIDPDVVCDVAEADRIGAITPGSVSVLEYLSLATIEQHETQVDHSVELLLGESLRTSIESGDCLWVALVHEDALAGLHDFFGPGLVHTAGPAIDRVPEHVGFHLEGRAVPIVLNPSHVLQHWTRPDSNKHELVRKFLTGIDTRQVSNRDFLALREIDVPVVARSTSYRLIRNPKFIAYVIVFAYSLLRALPVVFVPEFHGNVWILWGLDVVTALPYTWGLIAFVTGRTWWVRYSGLVVTIISFVAPYLYFWSVGDHYPWYVDAVVWTLIVSAIGFEIIRYVRDVLVKRALLAAPSPAAQCS